MELLNAQTAKYLITKYLRKFVHSNSKLLICNSLK